MVGRVMTKGLKLNQNLNRLTFVRVIFRKNMWLKTKPKGSSSAEIQ